MKILLLVLAIYIAYKLAALFFRRPKSESSKISTRKNIPKEVNAYYLVEFSYVGSSGEKTRRQVYVTSGKSGELFKGFCMLRKERRSFKFDRIVDDEVTDLSSGEVRNVSAWRNEFQNTAYAKKQTYKL